MAVLTAALISLLPAGAMAAGPAPDGFFGVNPGDLFRLPQSQWDTHLQTIAGDGVQTVRMGAWWSDLEPGPPVDGVHHYSWGDIDKQVVALARHGLQWEPLLCFSATWGSKIDGDYNAAPDGSGNFAAFGGALAKRYGPGGSFWSEHPELPALPATAYEVWNEENAKVYWQPATPGEYANLYAATRSAIKSVDSSARVIVGGLAGADNGSVTAPADFLRRMFSARPDLKGNVDAVGYHPYARDPKGVYNSIAAFRNDLDSIAGAGIPLELTEIGWTTVDVSESQRADYMGQVATTLARTNCGIERVSAYAWLGPEQAAGDREQWFGRPDLLEPGLAQRPHRERQVQRAQAPDAARQGPPPPDPPGSPPGEGPLLDGLQAAGRAEFAAGREPRGRCARDDGRRAHEPFQPPRPDAEHQLRQGPGPRLAPDHDQDHGHHRRRPDRHALQVRAPAPDRLPRREVGLRRLRGLAKRGQAKKGASPPFSHAANQGSVPFFACCN